MSSPRALDPRRIAAAFSLALLLALMMPPVAGAAAKVRTDPGKLPGYTATATGSPLSMLLYEEVIPVPVDPGEPHGEGSLSYSRSKLETGPVSRGVASSFWPGAAVGDGFATLCDQVTNRPENPEGQECEEEYRVKADARWPASKQFPKEDSEQIKELGAGMFASALGLDTFARASSSESPNEEALGLGNARSRSDTTVLKNEVVATTVASAEDVKIGGGVISIDSVKTELLASSDAKKGKTSGVTKVNGLVIGGQGYTIDEKGLRPIQGGKPGEGTGKFPAMPGAGEMNKQLGIQVELLKHKETVTKEADATRSAGGLRISIRTEVLKKALTDNIPVDDVLGQLPEETDPITIQLAALFSLAPQIDFIFGRGTVRAAGSEGNDFNFPPLPTLEEPPPLEPPAETTGGTAGTPAVSTDTAPTGGGGGSAPAPDLAPADNGGGGPAVPSAQEPVAAGEAQLAAAPELPDFFGGLPPGMVAVGLGLAALGGKALAGLTGAAMAGVSGALCDRGALRKIPNLRS